MNRRGGRGAGRGSAAAALLAALLAACETPEGGAPEGAELRGPAPATGAATGGASPAPLTDAPARAPSDTATGSILGLSADEIMAEVEAGTGRIALVRKPPPFAAAAGAPPALEGPFACTGDAAGENPDPAEAGAARRPARTVRDPEADRALAETRRGLGLALESAGDIEGAASEFEAALAAPWEGQTADSPWADLARICRRAEPAAAVARACTRVLNARRFSPADLAEFIANRGDAHARLGRSDLATADYRAALKIESGNFRALVGRARLHVAEGRPGAALNDLRLAVATGPRPAEARMVRARALTALGEHERAVADYDAILADATARPWHQAAWRGRAGAHCALGRPEAAAVDWQVWADSVPGGPVYVQELLRGRGYLKGPWEPGFGPATLAALHAWTREGCR